MSETILLNPSYVHPTYRNIPLFFQNECLALGLPVRTLQIDTAGFVQATLALPHQISKERVRGYVTNGSGYNYLLCFLHAVGVSGDESQRIIREVSQGLQDVDNPN